MTKQPTDDAIHAYAERRYGNADVEISHMDNSMEYKLDGCWVEAFLWVPYDKLSDDD